MQRSLYELLRSHRRTLTNVGCRTKIKLVPPLRRQVVSRAAMLIRNGVLRRNLARRKRRADGKIGSNASKSR
ncbi:hypothetical protein ZHAS_00012734 [Anopheles sinensis]|uniref:Uncharacterized protein n=1 Tax=Anopheles sinensis TaxID=74873 RepID=A0A084W3N0_ANOSI|nr:hypothetical protein ZHAS_00012734 [Anopheles sinensis]